MAPYIHPSHLQKPSQSHTIPNSSKVKESVPSAIRIPPEFISSKAYKCPSTQGPPKTLTCLLSKRLPWEVCFNSRPLSLTPRGSESAGLDLSSGVWVFIKSPADADKGGDLLRGQENGAYCPLCFLALGTISGTCLLLWPQSSQSFTGAAKMALN